MTNNDLQNINKQNITMVKQILKMCCVLVQTRMPIASHSVQRERCLLIYMYIFYSV